MTTSDYFAELYVAGRFADAGWNVYFPHRDKGFDFIVSKPGSDGAPIIRPVQVKGKYPTSDKGDRLNYGYIGKLTQLHKEMVLAIPYFVSDSSDMPRCTAYMPISLVKKHPRGYRCEPASFASNKPIPRAHYKKFFDKAGLSLVEACEWPNLGIGLD